MFDRIDLNINHHVSILSFESRMDREVDSTHRVCTGRCTVLFLDVLPPSSSSACLLERRTDGRTAGATGATGGGGRADDVSSGELPAVVVAVSGRRQWSLFCCEVYPLERFCRHGSFHHE